MSADQEIEFTFKLLNQVANAAVESTVFSSASILNGLAILLSGAKGSTADEIIKVIGNGV